jgi:hypothetical protein
VEVENCVGLPAWFEASTKVEWEEQWLAIGKTVSRPWLGRRKVLASFGCSIKVVERKLVLASMENQLRA